MDQIILSDLEQLGRDAARHVAGDEAISAVHVTPADTFDGHPAYDFSFRIDPDLAEQGLGFVLIRLSQWLSDELIARGDMTYPRIELLSEAEWDQRDRA